MSARRAGGWIALGIVIYASALVATAPAAWLSYAASRLSDARLELRDAKGTAWTGSGRLYARHRSGDLAELGPLRWKAVPASLLRGRLHAELHVAGAERPAQLLLGPGGLALQDVDIELPAAALAAFVPALDALGPKGRVRVRTDSLRIDERSVLGLAEVEWREAGLARPQEVEFGSHIARVRGGGAKVALDLGTLEGPLKLSARGAWSRDDGLSLSGSAEPHAPKLAAYLKSLCAEFRDSRCWFRYPR